MSGSCSICTNCQSCQSFCENSKQLATDHTLENITLGEEVKKNDIIIDVFPRSKLNTIGAEIARISKKGSVSSSNNDATWTDETRLFLYHDKMNELLDLMKDMYSKNSVPPEVEKDQLITAEWFESLNKALKKLSLDPGACDKCNTTCNTCVSCQHSSCHSSCHTSTPSPSTGGTT